MKFIFIISILLFSQSAIANNPLIAVATNFNHTMNSIVDLFEQKYQIKINVSYGSTGSLYSQISNGAPFDAFFSADSKTVDLIDGKEMGIKESQFIYSLGSLVFLCNTCAQPFSWKQVIYEQDGKISIANPRLAPYGRAAVEVLKSVDNYSEIKKRIVYGNNVGQAFQYVQSRNIPFGFVAKSLVIAGKVKSSFFKEINKSLYSPIKQSAIILKRTKYLQEMNLFFKFIKSKEIKELIERSGYRAIGNMDVK